MSTCPFLNLTKRKKTKQRRIGKWHHCTSTLNKKGRRLSAESEGLKPNALNVVSRLASCQFLCLGVDNVNKLWLEGSSTHEETVNILLGGEFFASSTGHRTWKSGTDQWAELEREAQKLKNTDTCSVAAQTSIDDPYGVGYSLGYVLLKPLPQLLVNLLSLIRVTHAKKETGAWLYKVKNLWVSAHFWLFCC